MMLFYCFSKIIAKFQNVDPGTTTNSSSTTLTTSTTTTSTTTTTTTTTLAEPEGNVEIRTEGYNYAKISNLLFQFSILYFTS